MTKEYHKLSTMSGKWWIEQRAIDGDGYKKGCFT
jgi:hypothetical protein